MALQRPRGLTEEVYDSIFNKLVSLEIAPGARVTVDALVRELEVSQTPIREALGRLEGEGLVDKEYLVGFRAASLISRQRFEDLYEMRMLLEPYAARLAAAKMNAPSLKALGEIATRMSKFGTGQQRLHYSKFARLDADFHDQILAIAGNDVIRDTLEHLHVHFHIFRLTFNARVTQDALGEHARLLVAFDRADADEAERAMRDHIERSRQRLLAAFA